MIQIPINHDLEIRDLLARWQVTGRPRRSIGMTKSAAHGIARRHCRNMCP
jgi:hypothetical protein